MKTMFKARPTVYNGIQMRSRLEAGYAAWLDRWRFDWEYEPCAFSDDSGRQYLPDFRLNNVRVAWSDKPQTVYVEVKPPGFEDYDSLCMEVILASDPAALLMLAQPHEPVPKELGWYYQFAAPASLLEPDRHVACFWPMRYDWIEAGRGRLMIARPLWWVQGPWVGEWWKGHGT